MVVGQAARLSGGVPPPLLLAGLVQFPHSLAELFDLGTGCLNGGQERLDHWGRTASAPGWSGIGHDTLHLSVAAPPLTREHALPVAAEYFASCTDNIVADLIGFKPKPLVAHAEQIRGQRSWSFWWD
jgi:hypothetical protein